MVTKLHPKQLLLAVRETAQNYGVSGCLGLLILLLIPNCLRSCLLFAGGVVFLANVIAPFVFHYRPRGRVSSKGKSVFISGCDSGFGHGIAQVLDDAGYQVFAGCLFPEGDGAVKLRKSTSSRLHIIELDVTKDDSVSNAAAYVKEHLNENKLWAVVNNAGINDGAELHWTDTEILKRVIEVNAIGVVRVTKAFLSKLIENEGRVVTVASAAGRYTYPGMVAYCMSKQAAVSFSDGLRLEMYKTGVKVITIEPWMYKTSITETERVHEYIMRTWNKAPEDIRQFYGPGYIEKYKRSTVKTLTLSIRDNPGEVVNCIKEAVTAKHPRYSYSPGSIYSRLTNWLIQRLPKPIADLLILRSCVED